MHAGKHVLQTLRRLAPNMAAYSIHVIPSSRGRMYTWVKHAGAWVLDKVYGKGPRH